MDVIFLVLYFSSFLEDLTMAWGRSTLNAHNTDTRLAINKNELNFFDAPSDLIPSFTKEGWKLGIAVEIF